MIIELPTTYCNLKAIVSLLLAASPFSIQLLAQNNFIVTGRVVDRESRAPIEYASVTIKNSSIGVISNSQGEFEFHIPQKFSGDSLFVSMLGYSSYKEVAGLVQKNSVIFLSQRNILLNEVVVTGKELSADEIVSKAIKAIGTNYRAMPYKMEGFFRQVQKVDEKYVSVLEAAVDIFDPGYGNNMSDKINIVEIRRSNYFNTKGYINSADTFYTQKHNSLKSTISFNDVHRISASRVRDQNFFGAKYEYKLDNAIFQDGRYVYVISAIQKANRGYLKDPLKENRFNTIMIDAETFGILKVIFDYSPKAEYEPKDFKNVTKANDSILSVVSAHQHVYEFSTYQGLLYLKYVRWSDLVQDYNVKQNKISHVNEYRHELLINNVETDPFRFSEIKETMKSHRSLHVQTGNYNSDFWKSYNVIYDTQRDKKLIEDLMKRISNSKKQIK